MIPSNWNFKKIITLDLFAKFQQIWYQTILLDEIFHLMCFVQLFIFCPKSKKFPMVSTGHFLGQKLFLLQSGHVAHQMIENVISFWLMQLRVWLDYPFASYDFFSVYFFAKFFVRNSNKSHIKWKISSRRIIWH